MKSILTILILVSLSSCSGLTSAVTGQPIPSTEVRRANNEYTPNFNVSSIDLIQAERAPSDRVWGLYDAGKVARQIGKSIGTK